MIMKKTRDWLGYSSAKTWRCKDIEAIKNRELKGKIQKAEHVLNASLKYIRELEEKCKRISMALSNSEGANHARLVETRRYFLSEIKLVRDSIKQSKLRQLIGKHQTELGK